MESGQMVEMTRLDWRVNDVLPAPERFNLPCATNLFKYRSAVLSEIRRSLTASDYRSFLSWILIAWANPVSSVFSTGFWLGFHKQTMNESRLILLPAIEVVKRSGNRQLLKRLTINGACAHQVRSGIPLSGYLPLHLTFYRNRGRNAYRRFWASGANR